MHRLAALSAVAVLSLALVACGSTDGSTTGAASSGSASASPTRGASPVAQRGDVLFADVTRAMVAAKTARGTFRSTVAGQAIAGSGAFRFGRDLAADLVVRLPGQGSIGARLLPGAFYVKLPASAGLPAGKPWLRIDRNGDDPVSKAFGPVVTQLKSSFDPSSNLGLLKATTTVTPAGREVVGGVATTKYTATVDLAKAAAAADGALAQQYRTLVTSGVRTLDYAIWVDAKSLPRKFATTVPTKQGDVTATGSYSDWGAPVSVAAPRRSQVATPGDLGLPGMGVGGSTAG